MKHWYPVYTYMSAFHSTCHFCEFSLLHFPTGTHLIRRSAMHINVNFVVTMLTGTIKGYFAPSASNHSINRVQITAKPPDNGPLTCSM